MSRRLTTGDASQYFVYSGKDSCDYINTIRGELLGLQERNESGGVPEIIDEHVKIKLGSWGEQARSLCSLQQGNFDVSELIKQVNRVTNDVDGIVDSATHAADKRALAIVLLSVFRAAVGVFVALCTLMSTKKIHDLKNSI